MDGVGRHEAALVLPNSGMLDPVLAVKHFDIVVGLDVHIVQPPGTVPPVPIPHPHVAIVLDPFDYLPLIGATVKVNGLPRGQAGSAAMPIPSHIPIGGVFVKPPANESELLMGSKTVEVESQPFAYMALPVLACADVGGLPPLRPVKPDPSELGKPPAPKQKGPPIGLVMPSCVVLPIPIGKPVLVGGPPTISLMALAFRAGFMALGAAFRGLRKLAKQSEEMANYAAKIHRKAAHWMDALDMSESARHKVHDAICTMTGHPVDVATGKVLTSALDLEVGGPLPLVFERKWFSSSSYRGPLGHGWHHGLDLALVEGDDVVAIRLADGRMLAAPKLAIGESWFDRREKLELVRDPRGYRLRSAEGSAFGFVPRPGAASPLAWVEDASGNQIVLRYAAGSSAREVLVEILDSAGRRFPITSDEQGRLTEIRGPHPEQDTIVTWVRYVYDRQGDLIEAHDALGQVARWAYDDHLLVRETDRVGLSFHFEWDRATRRCVRTWGDGGIHDHRLAFEDAKTTVTNALGFCVVAHHDDAGLVVRTIDALGHASSLERNEFHEVVASVDALGQRTRITRDARGNPVTIVAPDGTTQTLIWDARDRLQRAVDVLGNWWQWRWDERGRLLEQVGPGVHTRMLWQGPRLAGQVGSEGLLRRFEYDAHANPNAIAIGERVITRTQFDRLGRIIGVEQVGATQRLRRDLLGRVVEHHLPDGNVRQVDYDGEGQLVRERDRLGEVLIERAGMGRIVAQHRAGTSVRFIHDSEEHLIGFINEAGLEHRFELDGRADVIAEQGFDGRRTRYERDPLGRVIALTPPSGKTRKHTWNRAGQLAKVEYADGEKTEFGYRADGALISARNPTTTISIERDPLGRVTREWQAEHWVASTLARDGKRLRMRSSFGADLAIERGAFGEWLGLHYVDAHDPQTRWDAKVARDQAGREIDRQLPGGVRSRWAFDPAGRPFQHQLWDGRAVARNRKYAWDVQARLGQIVDSVSGTQQFGHDERGFLAWAQRDQEPAQLRLPDQVGNIFRAADLQDRRHGPLGNLLESTDPEGRSTKYTWDDDGNLIRREDPEGAWKYHWSAAGKLNKVERPDGQLVEFGYDAFSRRIWKQCGDRITRWIWDGDVVLHEWQEAAPKPSPTARAPTPQFDEDGDATGFVLPAFVPDRARALVADDEATGYIEPAFVPLRKHDPSEFLRPKPAGLITWLFEPGRFAPIAKIAATLALCVIVDHLGTPFSLLDGQGRSVWTVDLSIDGGVRDEQGEIGACPFRFPGQYADSETGLSYNLFRYFDPVAGIYVSADPAGIWAGARPFTYVRDPLVWIDPLGLVQNFDTCADIFADRIVGRRFAGYSEGVPVNTYGIRNINGGETWVFDASMNGGHALGIIANRNPNRDIIIMTGIHGSPHGGIALQPDFVLEDRELLTHLNHFPLLSPYAKNVHVADITNYVKHQEYEPLQELVNDPAIVICNWCWSDRTPFVVDSLLGIR